MKVSEGCSDRKVNSNKRINPKISNLVKPSLVALAVAQSLSISSAQAATIEVNTNTDDGRKCTLRKAVLSVNNGLLRPGCSNTGGALGDNDTILFADTLSNDTITLTKGRPLTINAGKSVLIDASSNERLTISGPIGNSPYSKTGIFSVSGASLSIDNLTIIKGSASLGGGIYASDSSLINIGNSSIAGNNATQGAGIWLGNYSSAEISNSSFAHNVAYAENNATIFDQGGGGGIAVTGGSSLILKNSLLTENAAPRNSGGGLYVLGSSQAVINNSTLVEHYALSGSGAVINQDSSLTVVNSTLSNNYSGGAVVLNSSSSFNLINSTMVDYLPFSPGGAQYAIVSHSEDNVVSAKNSIILVDCISDSGSTATFSGIDNTNIASLSCGGDPNIPNPSLLPLNDNVCNDDESLCTQTHALPIGSSAVGIGDLNTCVSEPVNGLDQRGFTRGEDGLCDIGAYESPVVNYEQPSISVDNIEVSEGDSSAKLVISLSSAQTEPIPVDFQTVRGTATEYNDYRERFGTMTFTPGQTEKVRFIELIDDLRGEPTESFSFLLSNPVGANLAQAQAEVTILDDDIISSVPTISFEEYSLLAVESDDGNGAYISFVINLSHPIAEKVSVDYQTADITAVRDLDYVARSGRMTFAPGQTRKVRNVYVMGDTEVEIDETFNLVLSNPSGNAVIRRDQTSSTATIIDNDTSELPKISILPLNAYVNEGLITNRDIDFWIGLSEPQTEKVSVDFQTVDGTAIAGEDYVARSGTMTFMPGQTEKRRTIQLLDDGLVEDDETFELILSNPSNGVELDIGGKLYDTVGVIWDDERDVPSVSIEQAPHSVTEGDEGSSQVINYTINMIPALTEEILFTILAIPITATSNVDYERPYGLVSLMPGQTSVTQAVKILGDAEVEPNETFRIKISNPTKNVLIDRDNVVATILDDD